MVRNREEVRCIHGCRIWRSIRIGWDRVAGYVQYVVGDSNRVRFWHDAWCKNRPLIKMHLELYVITINKDDLV